MKDGFIKVATARPDVRVADCAYNLNACLDCAAEADRSGVKLLVYPELCLTGYTCGDLFLQDILPYEASEALRQFAAATAGYDMVTVIGLPVAHAGKLYNCAAVCRGGQILGLVPKTHLPNYAEFYEARQFTPAPDGNLTYELDGQYIPFGTRQLFVCTDVPDFRFAVEICEDLWAPVPPSSAAASAGATVICNLSASNETIGKAEYRRSLVSGQSGRLVAAYLYANCGHGESTTDTVFSGHSLIAENGSVLAERAPFASGGALLITEIDVQRLAFDRRRMNTFGNRTAGEWSEAYFSLEPVETVLTRRIDPHPFVPDDSAERSRRCELILTMQAEGLATRMQAAHAKKLVVGISGGLDSCLALLCMVRTADRLGRPRRDVIAVTMPCFGTTARTRSNAETLCRELGVDFRTVDITDSVNRHFADIGHDPENRNVVYENAQARERTQVLMDIANAESGLVVGTGDLSELALGWATYNGDHMSMYAVNASVPKTLVRHLVGYAAEQAHSTGQAALAGALEDILNTPVSPELLPATDDGRIAQVTEDLVGPYELHDFYLYYLLRLGARPRKLYRMARYALGGTYDDGTLLRWLEVFLRRFFAQQFKRSCLPDGPKIGSAALSPRGDWRMPSDASAALWLREAEALKQAQKEETV